MDVAAGKKEDIHLGHAFARGCNAAAHKGAKNAPQMPALLHGPRRTSLPSPASHPLPSAISRFRSNCESKTLSTPRRSKQHPAAYSVIITFGLVNVFFSNTAPIPYYFQIAGLLRGMNHDAGGNK